MRPRAGTRFRREDAVALTPRQEEVLRLLERGHTNAEVAEALGISLDGAKFHVGEIIGKLGVSTREEAVEAWRARRRRRLPALTFLSLRWLGGGAAVLGVAAGAVLLAAVAVSDDDDPASAEEPAPSTQASPSALATNVPLMVSCPQRQPTPTPIAGAGQAAIDWIDFVRFEGISYAGHGFAPETRIAQSALGEPYGQVTFQLSQHDAQPGYEVGDCDASYLPVGTVLYTIEGYDPRFRLALEDGRIYEAYHGEGVTRAGQIIDLRGKVRAIEFRQESDHGPLVVGRIVDPAEITTLVDLFLAAEFDDSRGPPHGESRDEWLQLAFLLTDGTEFARAYEPDIGRVWPGIWLPAEFNEAANAALGR